MYKRLILLVILAVAASLLSANDQVKDDLAQINLAFQYQPVKPDSNGAIQISFSMAKDWHFYADEKTAPEGMELKVTAQGQGLVFANAVFPKGELYSDKVTGKKLAVFSGKFNVYIPFKTGTTSSDVKITIKGLACSEQLCKPSSYELNKKLEISASADMSKPAFVIPTQKEPRQSVGGANPGTVLSLAILAGLLLNVMPCVWPVLPIIVMRLVAQSKQNAARSIAMGLAFGAGIVLFFAVLAAVNIFLKLGFGMVFQWGDQFRNPAFVTGMAILMVVLALYMFNVFTFSIPVSVGSGKQSRGLAGSVAMGFLAAVLSTPCSFAILTFVLAWAQTQPIPLATITILLIGVGMALPYVILTSIPKLLAKIPKPGRWMELFKHATGFILLGIGVKLLEAVQADKIIDVLYYSIVIAVCVWMWGVCVSYDTPKGKKFIIRLAAIILAILFGFILLGEPQKAIIDWKPYDATVIASAQKNNQPVIIDFSADWCLSCKILDKTVFSSKQVADLIKQKGVLAIKADTTQFDYPATIALKEIYNEPAVPVTVLLLPGKETPIKLAGNLIKNELIKNLQSLKDVEK
ncbi:MAG: cytochrome c biogenesis protein CcdA [Sedimentisphaerales bacterium]